MGFEEDDKVSIEGFRPDKREGEGGEEERVNYTLSVLYFNW